MEVATYFTLFLFFIARLVIPTNASGRSPMFMRKNPAIADLPQSPILELDDHSIGWTTINGFSGRETVDRLGWRYEVFDDYTALEEIENLPLDFMDVKDPKFALVVAHRWRDLRFKAIQLFDCSNGIIMVIDVEFQYKVPKLNKARRAKDRWSNVTWALWERVCTGQTHNLQWIQRTRVVNPISKKLLEEAWKQTRIYNEEDADINGETAESIKTWKPLSTLFKLPITDASCNQEKGECDFYSLMYSPNVIGAAYMAMDYQQLLDFKKPSQISGFFTYRDNDDSVPCDDMDVDEEEDIYEDMDADEEDIEEVMDVDVDADEEDIDEDDEVEVVDVDGEDIGEGEDTDGGEKANWSMLIKLES